MGRKALTPAATVGPDFVGATPADMAAQEANVRQMIVVANENAQAMAEQLGYDGALSVGALEDEIRFYQRRTVEACLELGTRLVILKELTPHGEFGKRTELLGISERMARKFMAATLKFSNRNSSSVLQSAGTQTKLLELVILDDGEIEALENGESARGLTLDSIETMTVSELKSALRESREDIAAKDRVLAAKISKISELSAQVEKKPKVAVAIPWPEQFAAVNDEISTIGSIVDEVLGKHLTFVDAIESMTDNMPQEQLGAAHSCILRVGAQIERIAHLAAALSNEYETRLAGYVADLQSHVLPSSDEA